MSDEIFFDGQRFVSAAEASATADLSRDYVARLCRDGKVRGRRIGKNWYVHEDSLKHFLIEQEHTKAVRREHLSNERAKEYLHAHQVVDIQPAKHSAVRMHEEPFASPVATQQVAAREIPAVLSTKTLATHARQVQDKLKTGVLARSESAIRYAPSMLVTPSGVHEAVVRTIGHGTMHVPVHTLTPFAEFIQKFVALLVAFSMTFGTYALVDPSYARFAANSIQETLSSVGDRYAKLTGGGTDALAQRSKEKMYFAAEHPSAALAQVSGAALAFIPDSLKNLARAINSGVDDLIYAVAFPQSVTDSTALTAYDGASVSVEVAPYARGAQNLASSVPASSLQTQNTPSSAVAPAPVTVIERQIQTERIVSAVGGISEDYLNQRLAALESTLSNRLLGSTGGGGGGYTTINNNYSVIAATNNIDKLGSVTIDNSTFSGGTITGSAIDNATITGSSFAGSVSATTLSASATSSLATTTITGSLTVSGDTTISGTLSIPGALSISSSSISLLTNTYATTSFISAVTASTTNLTWVNATGTNATTTNFFSTNASTTNATSTNLFATIGRFTSAIIDSLTSYQSISGPSISATSTTATSTFAGGLLATRVPTLPHTFASWAIGAADSNLFDASFVINPASAVGDTNLFAAAVGGSVKFLVDAEGDVFVNNLTSVGSVTLSTTSASTFTVEGNATFGDSISDITTVNGSLIVTGTTSASTIQGNFGIGTSTPWARLSVAGVAGATTPLFAISSTTSGGATSTVFHIDSNGLVGIGTSSPAARFAVDSPIYIGGQGVTATSTFEGNVHVYGLLKVGTSSSYISNSDISTVGNLTVTGTTNLTGLLTLTNASTTRLSVFDKAYFGGTATSTFDSAGNLYVAGTAGIGAASVDASAVFQVDSTTKGFLPPRMTTAQKNAIGTPAAGLTIFDSSLSKLNVYNGTAWKNVGSTEINGEVTNGTEGSVLFIGDGAVLGQDTGFNYSTSTSRLGIGTTTPWAKLAISANSGETNTRLFDISSSTTSATTSIFTVLNSGNVGVGTANPGGLLEVTASAAAGDTTLLRLSRNGVRNWDFQTKSSPNNYLFLRDADAGRDVMAWDTAGQVGINDATPDYLLDVAGTLGVDGATTLSSTLNVTGDTTLANATTTNIFSTTASSTNLFASSATFGSLSVLGALTQTGLGTFTNGFVSQASSTIAGVTSISAGANIALSVTGGDVNGYTSRFNRASEKWLSTWAGNSSYSGLVTQGHFQLFTNGQVATPSLTVLDTGNVGIGNTSPWTKLSVSGGIAATASSTIGDGTQAGGLTILGGATTTGNAYFASSALPTSHLSTNNLGATGNYWGTLYVNDIALYNGSGVGLSTSGSDMNFFTQSSGASRLFIQNTSGNVGVGTTSPWAKLAISANSSETNTRLFDISSSTASATTSLFTVLNTGNVGIGTASPGNKLSVNGSLSLAATSFIGFTGDTALGASNFALYGDSSGTVLNSPAGQTLDLKIGNATKLRVDSSGNVGIGTTSPWKMLSVAGDIIGTNITATGTLAVAGAITSTATTANTFPYASTTALTNSGASYFGGNLSLTGSAANVLLGSNWLSGDGDDEGVYVGSTGNVGFGTSDPIYLLNLKNSATTPDAPMFAITDPTNNRYAAGIGFNNATRMSFYSGETAGNGTALGSTHERMVITTGGDVGIGNTSPWTKLSVSGGFAATASSTIGDGTQAGGLTISGGATTTGNLVVQGSATSTFANGISATYLNITGTAATSTFANGIQLTAGCFMLPDGECAGSGSSVTGTTGQLAYFSGTDTAVGTSTLFISSASNVGIGTSSPYAKLTVWGKDTSNSTLSFLVADSASTTVFSVSNGGVFNFGKAATSTIKDNTAYAWTIATSSDASPLFNIDTTAGAEVVNIGHTSSDVIIGGVGYGSDLVFEENASIRGQGSGRTITLGANSDVLAFGTAGLASCDLIYTDASGTISCGASDAVTWTASGDNIYRSTGSIGIGTSTPYYSLTVASSTGAQLALSDGTNNAWTFRNAGGSFFLATSTYSSTSTVAALSFDTNGKALFANTLTAISGGNVGIGTTTPWAKLSVSAADNASAPQFIVASSSAASFIVASTGNVGIGTASPSTRLDVRMAGATLLNLANTNNYSFMHQIGDSLGAGSFNGYLVANQGSAINFGIRTTTSGDPNFSIGPTGLIGIGTSTPFRSLSVTAAVATAQAALSYDTTRNTDFLTDSAGDLTINPSGDDVRLSDDNLWVCAGGSCPTGAPTGNGNLIVEGSIGVGTSTPKSMINTTASPAFNIFSAAGAGTAAIALQDGDSGQESAIATNGAGLFVDVSGHGTATNNNIIFRTNGTNGTYGIAERMRVNSAGYVGIGTSTPTDMLSVEGLLRVGANSVAPVTMGTATSTFNGDIKILGKLDVGTIDPVYTIDGIKYATYGHSTVGIKEETMQLVYLAKNDTGMYSHTIDFDNLKEGSDMWLFYQITDFGTNWKNLVISLTPTFSGNVHYEKNAADNTLTIIGDMPGEVSMRLVGNRFDFSKWPNLRTDQDGDFRGTHIISGKSQ